MVKQQRKPMVPVIEHKKIIPVFVIVYKYMLDTKD